MNKKELIELIESMKIDRQEFVILSTGALVLRGIWDKANDLDIAVTKKGLEELKNNYNLKQKPNGFYVVNDLVECVQDDMENKKELVNEYYLQDILDYLEYLETNNRPKDQEKIPKVKEYIKERNYIRNI